jgi:stearoyl-CoA desaturase (delta-9 desaturase)
LPYQIDTAWYYIKLLSLIGGVSSYKDFKPRFMRQHYAPYLARKAHAHEGEADGDRPPPGEA